MDQRVKPGITRRAGPSLPVILVGETAGESQKDEEIDSKRNRCLKASRREEMYKCQMEICGKQVPAHYPQNKVITEVRKRTYENRVGPIVERGRNKGKPRYKDVGKVMYSKGTEVVHELVVCPECYQEHFGLTPAGPVPVEVPTVSLREKNTRPASKKRPWKNPRRKNRADATPEKKPVVEFVKPLESKHS